MEKNDFIVTVRTLKELARKTNKIEFYDTASLLVATLWDMTRFKTIDLTSEEMKEIANEVKK